MKSNKKILICIFSIFACIVLIFNFVFPEKLVYFNVNKIDIEEGRVYYEVHNGSIRKLRSHLNPVEKLYKQNTSGDWDIIFRPQLIEDAALTTKSFSVRTDMITVDALTPGTYKLVSDDFSFGRNKEIFYKNIHLEFVFKI